MSTQPAVARQAIRARLARNPVAVECVRAAAAFSGGQAEVVVFEEERAFIAATSAVDGIMLPRPLTEAEASLLEIAGEQTTRPAIAIESGSLAVPITDRDGEVVAALSIINDGTASAPEALYALARLVAAELLDLAGHHDDAFHGAVLDGQRDAVVVLSPDLRILWASRGLGSLMGRTPAEVQGRSAADFLHPDDIEPTLHAITRIAQGLEVYRVNVRLLDASGTYNPVEVTGTDHSTDPVLGGMVLSLRDAQHHGELEAAVDRTRRISDAIVDRLRDGIVATDEYGAITVANDVARTMFGIDPWLSPAQLSLDDFALVNADGRPHELVGEMVDSDEICCVVSQRGAVRYVTTSNQSVEDDDGVPMGTVVVFHDVTSEHRAAEELRSQALHDQLTGLANRRQLEQRLSELALVSPEVNVAACFIDLDGFKLVNDNHGHRAGDQLVRIAAERVAREVGDDDLLVRQGGDEFVAVLVGVADIGEATAMAERCRLALAAPYRIGQDRFDVTASVGVAMATSADLGDERLLQHADIALYAAKKRGRNRVETFDAKLAEAVSSEGRQRRLLRDALDNDRLVMHFQPLLDAKSETTRGYEALARIRTVDGELLGPTSFIDAIANTGLMWDLDRAAFTLSCQAAALLARINPDRPPYMACNFSSVSLTHPRFIDFLTETVDGAGVAPTQICIEVTESAAFDAGTDSPGTLLELHRRGFMLALDDFGTGYSSLAHLRDLPISTVKVDRSFIAKLADHDSERAIAEAVVSLAKDLRLGVVAEGVETPEHLEHVQDLGFETVQGWHYSTALSLADCLQDWTDAAPRD